MLLIFRGWLLICAILYALLYAALSICYLAQASKTDTEVLLRGVGDKDTIEDVKRVLELVDELLCAHIVTCLLFQVLVYSFFSHLSLLLTENAEILS